MGSTEIENAKLGEGVTLILVDDNRFYWKDTIRLIKELFPSLSLAFYHDYDEALPCFKEQAETNPQRTILIMDDNLSFEGEGRRILQDLVDDRYDKLAYLYLYSSGQSTLPNGVDRFEKGHSPSQKADCIREMLVEIHRNLTVTTKHAPTAEEHRENIRQFLATKAPRHKEIFWGGNDPHDSYWTDFAKELREKLGDIANIRQR